MFNAGERVEAFTSPLWLAVLLVGDVLTPIRLEWVAVLGGIALRLVGITLRSWDRSDCSGASPATPCSIPVGALVFVSFAPVWRFTTGGLENGLTYTWLGACLYTLATWSTGDDTFPRWQMVVLGLGPLVRPELLLLSVAFVALVIGVQWAHDRWRDRLGMLPPRSRCRCSYEIFRMGYYASLVPNTAIAKEASRSYWFWGRFYFRQTFIESYALWLPLLILLVGAYVPLVLLLRATRAGARCSSSRRSSSADWSPRSISFGSAATTCPRGSCSRRCSPCWHRSASSAAEKAFAGATLVVAWAFVAIVGLRSGVDIPGFHIPKNMITAVAVPRPRVRREVCRAWVCVENPVHPGDPALQRPIAGRSTVVGVTSYRLGTDVHVLGLLGLGDPFMAHLRLDRRTIRHVNPDGAWIVAHVCPRPNRRNPTSRCRSSPSSDRDPGNRRSPAASPMRVGAGLPCESVSSSRRSRCRSTLVGSSTSWARRSRTSGSASHPNLERGEGALPALTIPHPRQGTPQARRAALATARGRPPPRPLR